MRESNSPIIGWKPTALSLGQPRISIFFFPFTAIAIEIIASVAVVVYVWKKGWQGKSLAGNK